MKKLDYIVRSYELRQLNPKNHDRISEQCRKTFLVYWDYIDSVRNKIDSTLYRLITRYNNFHDYFIRELRFNPWKKKVSLKINGYDEDRDKDLGDFTLYLNNITKFNIENELCKEYSKGIWHDKDCILVCEIGYYDNKTYLGIYTLYGTSIELYFDSVTLAKPNLNLLK